MEPAIIVIFGATGDLARRKLFPALFNLYLNRLLPANFAVVGLGRRLTGQEQFISSVTEAIREHSRQIAPSECQDFLKHLFYLQLDIQNTEDWERLVSFLSELDLTHQTNGNYLYYLSVSPEQFVPIITRLEAVGLNKAGPTSWRRVIIEKPFGKDLASARQLNQALTAIFDEDSIFRIDHYLGKGMLQNILTIRFANSVFEDVWNYKYIDHIQIRASETVGVEDRGPYYDQTGALRDMVQSHLLQSLTLIAMEPPLNLGAEAIRDEKVKVLRSLAPIPEESFAAQVVRGQYGPGIINGQRVKGYLEEDHIAPGSRTETFVALKLFVQNYRWAGVPFYLRTGKRLPEKSFEIIVQFKKLPGVMYFGSGDEIEPNILAITIQPQEGVIFRFNTKDLLSPDERVKPKYMDFTENDSGRTAPEAYERLLYDALNGDSTLFTRWDEVEYSWQFVDRIAQVWQSQPFGPLLYPANTWGPREADLMLARDGRKWITL
ncbi:MAG: glucose-6-phosphate dehydrogenase [Firmicutes bacterium]|nr:glucose-6-phosphate dehydrogenase [Bacillota bacterium]